MRFARNLFFSLGTLVCVFLCAATSVIAQTDAAAISGQIVDSTGAIVRGASVELRNMLQGTTSETKTNDAGIYLFPSVHPGQYSITVRKEGFKQVDLVDLVANTQAHIEQNVKLEVGSVSESITVTSSATSDSPVVSMNVSREFVENMPLNGQSFQDLIQLAPGTVSASGLYSVNGQRTDSNNFTVDGVASSFGGVVNGGNPWYLSGSIPAQTALGTTQSLSSVDSLQEFTIQTSGYTAEFGRSPGGQVQITTRSGTNDIHGALFDYFRNTVLDANSYYFDHYSLPQQAERQNDFGGTLGGPVIIPHLYDGKDKTFYFVSYEGLRLFTPASETEYLPTQGFRNSASQYVQPFLNALPLPNEAANNDGCTVTDPKTGKPTACDALFSYGFSSPNNVDNLSIRVDHNLSRRFHMFARYADTISSSRSGAENTYTTAIDTHVWTAGLTANLTSSLLEDLRFNSSADNEFGDSSLRSIGGSVPWSRSLLIPPAYESPFAESVPIIYIPNTNVYSFQVDGEHDSWIQQYQIVNSVTWSRGKHSLKFGGDWRRLKTILRENTYFSEAQFTSIADIQQGNASQLYTQATAPGTPIFDNLSLYAEDHWKVGRSLSLDYGLRWEFNPPPGPSNGHYPVTLTSSNLATAQLAPIGTQPYKTNYHAFAPRIGFSWNAIPSSKHSLTLRGGLGIFFDTAQQQIGFAYAGTYPFSVQTPNQSEVPLPITTAELTPPSLNFPLVPPYPYLQNISSPDLTLPYTESWNLSLDEALNARNTLTISYVGNNGKKLLYSEQYGTVPQNPLFTSVQLVTNASSSSYNSLQIQDTGRVANGLDLVSSFTWAHARDNGSTEYALNSPVWGNSDNDLPLVLNLALNYQTPTVGGNRWMHALTHGWLLANRFSAQSGYPLDISQTFVVLSNGTQAEYRPDLVPGVSIYLHGSAADVNGQTVPGNWRLNSAAFALVPTDSNGNPLRQGTLGRNYVRNPPFWALNTAIQRNFLIYERLHLTFRVDAFNIFNHPSLSQPDTYLPDSTFGELIGGNTTTIGSANSLYAMGSSRSLQLSLKLQF